MGSTLDEAEIGRRMLQILDRTMELTAGAVRVYDASGNLYALSGWGLEVLAEDDSLEEEIEPARRRTLEAGQRRSLRLGENLVGVLAPLRGCSGPIGLLEVYGPDLGQAEEEFLSSVSIHAAMALGNSQLYGRLLEHEQRLQGLVEKMVRIQEDERRRVAHEVHDGLTQTLIAINHHLQAYSRDFPAHTTGGRERLDRVLQLTGNATDEVQRITFGLRPTVLEDFGVAAAIRSEIESLEAQGFRVSYSGELGVDRLPEAVETTLYRIAQEALSNVRRHARVDSAELSLRRTQDELWLRVSDRGGGFDPEEDGGEGGLGLLGMRERAELIGGRFELESCPEQGTEIRVVVPISATAQS